MKKLIIFLVCFTVIGSAFAQDNVPYLSDSDITAVETEVPEEKLFIEEPQSSFPGQTANEMPRLNSTQPVYQLLVLDRLRSPDADISDADNMQILYKYRHGRNGYLILLYVSPAGGPVFPQLPEGSRIMLNFSSLHPRILNEYINSNVFRRFVSNQTILTQLQEAIRGR